MAATISAPPKDSPVASHGLLKELVAGNKRFVEGKSDKCHADIELVKKLTDGQAPHAIIVACSDSRGPPELIFDQGLGELFIIRVAGNVANQHVYGSILYAVQHLKTKLVVVMGHSNCGAVKATVGHFCSASKQPLQDDDPIGSLLQSIEPVVERCASGREASDADPAFLRKVSKSNSQYVAEGVRGKLRERLPEELHAEVAVASAIYNLEDGTVDFLDIAEVNSTA